MVVPDFACEILPITVFCIGARPRFCDVDRKTCAMTSTSLKDVVGANTKAAILIHPFGLPADTLPIKEIAEKMGIILVEDAAQSLGASINRRRTGSFGDVGVLSFNKFLNCNLGGAAVTNDENLADKIRTVRAEKEKKSLFPWLGHHLIEACKLKSGKNMNRILWADEMTRRAKVKLTQKHLHYSDSWAIIDSYALELWRTNALTSNVIDQLMTYGGTFWHRRRMEGAELLLLNSELKNVERQRQDRRRIAEKYNELLKERGFDKIPLLDDSDPTYLRYPVIVHDKSKLNMLTKALYGMGFNTYAYRYRPLHVSPLFGDLNGKSSYPDASYVSEHILPHPIVPGMNSDRIARIVISVIDVDKPD